MLLQARVCLPGIQQTPFQILLWVPLSDTKTFPIRTIYNKKWISVSGIRKKRKRKRKNKHILRRTRSAHIKCVINKYEYMWFVFVFVSFSTLFRSHSLPLAFSLFISRSKVNPSKNPKSTTVNCVKLKAKRINNTWNWWCSVRTHTQSTIIFIIMVVVIIITRGDGVCLCERIWTDCILYVFLYLFHLPLLLLLLLCSWMCASVYMFEPCCFLSRMASKYALL